MAVGDDRGRTCLQETGRVVVDALPGDAHARFGLARLRVARGVAEVMEHDHGAGRQVEGRDVRLAVVDVVVSPAPSIVFRPKPFFVV